MPQMKWKALSPQIKPLWALVEGSPTTMVDGSHWAQITSLKEETTSPSSPLPAAGRKCGILIPYLGDGALDSCPLLERLGGSGLAVGES